MDLRVYMSEFKRDEQKYQKQVFDDLYEDYFFKDASITKQDLYTRYLKNLEISAPYVANEYRFAFETAIQEIWMERQNKTSWLDRIKKYFGYGKQ